MNEVIFKGNQLKFLEQSFSALSFCRIENKLNSCCSYLFITRRENPNEDVNREEIEPAIHQTENIANNAAVNNVVPDPSLP